MAENDGHTIVAPLCDEHPPLKDWPAKNLILGTCPECGQWTEHSPKAARELRARQLIREREETKR